MGAEGEVCSKSPLTLLVEPLEYLMLRRLSRVFLLQVHRKFEPPVNRGAATDDEHRKYENM
jgi:hypothetical protein